MNKSSGIALEWFCSLKTRNSSLQIGYQAKVLSTQSMWHVGYKDGAHKTQI